MAKQPTVNEPRPGPITRMLTFIEEVKVELNKVTWPTKEDLKVSTKVTLFLLGVMAALIFGYDQVFQFIVVTLLRLAT
jgi:preprotein translocase subunit SecE